MFCENLYDISPIATEYFMHIPVHKNDTDAYEERLVTEYELEFVEKIGGNPCVTVNGKPDYLKQYCIHFRRPGMIVQGMGHYKSRYISFKLNSAGTTNDAFNLMPTLYFLESYAEIQEIFQNIFDDYYNDHPTLILNFKIQILQIIEIMVNDWYFETNKSKGSAAEESIKKSMAYIRENFSSPLTITDLAAHSGYSIFHYTRLFKEVAHWTPVQYLNRCRVNHAKKILAETHMTSVEILTECGFNSYSYFFRVFKNMCDMTPNQYRTKHSVFRG